ncbi:MAG: hypothetical protein R3F23_00940 [Verrucomicrobiia bacterium]
MKTFLFCLLGLTLSALAEPQSPIPSEVLVATDIVSAKDFKLWKENDRKKYNGTYSGDVGGDTEGVLTVNFEQKVTDLSLKTSDFLASGIYRQKTPNTPETVVLYKNAPSYEDSVINTGPFSIIFVIFEKQKGAIIGNIFLPRKK